jgi:uncharacterized protein (TIGR03435 family)
MPAFMINSGKIDPSLRVWRVKPRRRFVLQFAFAIFSGSAILVAPYLGAQASDTQPTQTAAASDKPAANTRSFDAISIKVDTSGSGRHSLSPNIGGGRLRGVNISLATLMIVAYQIPGNRILGTPSWFDSEYFDIDATTSDGTGADNNFDRIKAMLADRFKLTAHDETRNLPVYALLLDKPGKLGPQLRASDANCSNWQKTDLSKPNAASDEHSTPDDVNCGDDSGSTNNVRTRYVAHGVGMDKMIEVLAGPPAHPNVERPIVDQTGLTGKFDYVLEYRSPFAVAASANGASDPAAAPSFETALREELGLKLQPATAPVGVLVIDHVEEPTPN